MHAEFQLNSILMEETVEELSLTAKVFAELELKNVTYTTYFM